jgi:glycosyltransferase involved in cell wall biosynthesis
MSATPPGADRVRVAYLLTVHPAVSQTFIVDEIEALAEIGVDVVPISINEPSAHDVPTPAHERIRDSTFYIKARPRRAIAVDVLTTVLRHPSLLVLPLRPGGFDVRAYVWRSFQLAEAIVAHGECRRRGVRHIHAHFGQAPSTIAWMTADVGRVCEGGPWTWSATIHGWHEFVDERAALLRQKVAAASFIACVSDFTRSQLMRISRPEDWSKVHVVRCGIDPELIPLRPPTEPGTPPILLQVARLAPEKGHLVMLDAVDRLRREGVEVRLRLIGPTEGAFGQVVRERIGELGLEDAVELIGPCDPQQVREHLAVADVFCLPTFAEGLPVAIMEAMAAGVPVVTTYISGIPELAVDGETARVVAASRADLLADALRDVLDDDAARARMVSAARERVVRQHTLRRNVGRLRDLFAATTA